MALPDLGTPEGLAEAIKLLDPDFQGLLERKGVGAQVQGGISNADVKYQQVCRDRRRAC